MHRSAPSARQVRSASSAWGGPIVSAEAPRAGSSKYVYERNWVGNVRGAARIWAAVGSGTYACAT